MEWKKLFLALVAYFSLGIVIMALHKPGTTQSTTPQIQKHF